MTEECDVFALLSRLEGRMEAKVLYTQSKRIEV